MLAPCCVHPFLLDLRELGDEPQQRGQGEELVGEIYDEYDTGADHEDRVSVANGSVDVDGGLILQEFESVTGIALPEGRYETGVGPLLELSDAQLAVTAAAAQRIQAEFELASDA